MDNAKICNAIYIRKKLLQLTPYKNEKWNRKLCTEKKLCNVAYNSERLFLQSSVSFCGFVMRHIIDVHEAVCCLMKMNVYVWKYVRMFVITNKQPNWLTKLIKLRQHQKGVVKRKGSITVKTRKLEITTLFLTWYRQVFSWVTLV